MKKLLLIIGICVCASIAAAQGARFGDSTPTYTTTAIPGVSGQVVKVLPNATINFCGNPVNAVPCTNKVTTYTDATLTVSCSTSVQIVLAGTSTCVGATDSQGKWGVWVPAGSYNYTITANGQSFGPFPAVIASGGGGGGGGTPGGASTNVQVNDNSTFGGFSGFTFDKSTSTVGFPDLAKWSPAGVTAPNNAALKVDGNLGASHVFNMNLNSTAGIFQLTVGSPVSAYQGGLIQLNGKDNGAGSGAEMNAYANSTVVGVSESPTRSGADELGFNFGAGNISLFSDVGCGTGTCSILALDRLTRSSHFYGPIVFPNGAGTGASYGSTGAVPVSQGSSTPVKWSSDLSGPFGIIGTFGSCAGITPSGTQSAFCFGPAGVIYASYGGDAFQAIPRGSAVSAGGTNGQIQFNSSGSLGGFTASGDATVNVSTGAVTVAGLNGTSLAGLSTGIMKITTGTGVPSTAVAGDFPTLNQNTTGTASNLSGTPALPNGVTTTTQAANSNDTKLSTDAYADRVIAKPLLTGNSAVNTTFVTTDFNTSAAGQTAITGLSWTLPANTAANYKFDCTIWFSEATSATVLTWSINDVTLAPSNMVARAVMETSTAAETYRVFVGVSATGSQTVMSATPSGAPLNLFVDIGGFVEQPSGSASVLQFEVGVGGGTNVLTVKRGSSCRLSQ